MQAHARADELSQKAIQALMRPSHGLLAVA